MTTHISRCVLCALVALSASSVHAAVSINEIAWMGTTVSANDEWIELFNDGTESVSLDGWRLVADDGAPDIALSGNISAGGYFLLERTDDTTVPDVPADIIYTGALGNETENLSLIDSLGATQDNVKSGDGWTLGGNNTTKHTAQRQPDGGWITGVPTPRVPNSAQDTGRDDGEVKGESTSSDTGSTAKKTTSGYKQIVYAYAGEDMTAIAGAFAFFRAYGVNEKNEQLNRVRYTWTFGDGDATKGKAPRHIYHFPGTYTAVLSVSSDERDSRDTVSVRVMPADIAIVAVMHGDDGYISLHNRSTSPVDLSLWQLRAQLSSGKRRVKIFTIPMTTTIAPNTAVPFPAVITKLSPSDGDVVELVLPNERVISSYHVVVPLPVTTVTP